MWTPTTIPSTSCSCAKSNLVLNPSFESMDGAASQPIHWTPGDRHGRASDKRYRGSWSLKSTYTGVGTATRSEIIWVEPNTMYRLSGWIYKSSAAGHACIDMNDREGELQLPASLTGVWQYVSGTWYSGPATPNLVVLRLVTDGSPDAPIWFDDVRFAPQ
jgi:hypothetical protein